MAGMLGSESAATDRASLSKRAKAPGTRAIPSGMTLMAVAAEPPAGPPIPKLELTRFRGHLRMKEGVHDGKTKAIFGGVAGRVGAAGSRGTNAGGIGTGVRAIGGGD